MDKPLETASDREILIDLQKDVKEIKGYWLKDEMTMEDVAAYLGCSRELLYKKPWLKPNYGETTLEGQIRWTRDIVMEWFRIPEYTRKNGWLEIRAGRNT